jgi:tetratricopeptide (TPR) repeat protein
VIDEAAKSAGDNTRTISSIAQAYLDISAEDKALALYGPEFLNKNIGTAAVLGPYASFWTRQDKNLDSALIAAKKAVEVAPDGYAGWVTLANVYLKLKDARGPEGHDPAAGGPDQVPSRGHQVGSAEFPGGTPSGVPLFFLASPPS